jgi:PadR family transcriptional regulator PadR
MDRELKKGLLDVCVLKVLSKEASYGYKIITDVSKYVDVSESTLYPVLKRLEYSKCLDTYKEEHNGRLRKYYKITDTGKQKLDEFKEENKKIKKVIDFILGGSK